MAQHRKIRVIETGQVFKSANQAAEVIHASAWSIRQVCQGKMKSHMGFTYEYVKD